MAMRIFAIAVLIAACSQTLFAQESSGVTFDTILKGLEKQKGTYHTNKRITGTVKDYLIEANSGAPAAKIGDDWDFELVLDATGKQRRTVTSSRLKPAARFGTGVYATADIYYTVKRDGDQYYIDNFVVRNNSLLEFVRVTTQGLDGFVSSFDGWRSLEYVAGALHQPDRLGYKLSVDKPARRTRAGMEVVAVQSQLIPKALKALKAEEIHKGIKQTSYFDPNHSFVFLGAESSIPYTIEHPWPHRRESVLEYHTAADGKQPMPKRFTRYFQKENGEKLIDYEIDYKTYEDYVPDAEEFRLEKRYGLTTPVGPEDKVLAGKRGSPSSRRAWYWALFLVATVLVAGFVFFRYRRRRIARVPSTSGKS